MPSDFETLYLGIAMPAVFGLHGRPVTYAGDDGASADVLAVVGPEAAEVLDAEDGTQGRTRLRYRTVELASADVAGTAR